MHGVALLFIVHIACFGMPQDRHKAWGMAGMSKWVRRRGDGYMAKPTVRFANRCWLGEHSSLQSFTEVSFVYA